MSPYSYPVEVKARELCQRDHQDPDELIAFWHPKLGAFRAPLWHDYTTDAQHALQEVSP